MEKKQTNIYHKCKREWENILFSNIYPYLRMNIVKIQAIVSRHKIKLINQKSDIPLKLYPSPSSSRWYPYKAPKHTIEVQIRCMGLINKYILTFYLSYSISPYGMIII